MKVELQDQEICAAVAPFGFKPTSSQIAAIRAYVALLLKWNGSVSLTTVTNPLEIVARHIGESVFVTTLLPVENGRLADVGSGAGFPGLAIKISAPGISITLIESNKKKCVFLSEVSRRLGLTNVEVLPIRFEQLPFGETVKKFDYITARALGSHREFLKIARKHLAVRGHVILWLGGDDATQVSTEPDWIWQPAIRIPESQRRFILIGRAR